MFMSEPTTRRQLVLRLHRVERKPITSGVPLCGRVGETKTHMLFSGDFNAWLHVKHSFRYQNSAEGSSLLCFVPDSCDDNNWIVDSNDVTSGLPNCTGVESNTYNEHLDCETTL